MNNKKMILKDVIEWGGKILNIYSEKLGWRKSWTIISTFHVCFSSSCSNFWFMPDDLISYQLIGVFFVVFGIFNLLLYPTLIVKFYPLKIFFNLHSKHKEWHWSYWYWMDLFWWHWQFWDLMEWWNKKVIVFQW